MLKVAEVFGKEAALACAKFSVEMRETDRVFLMSGEESGVGLTRFEGGAVRISRYLTSGGEQEKELILRTLLLDATRLQGYPVTVEQEGDYSRFGFEKKADGWWCMTDKIIFPHECKGDR